MLHHSSTDEALAMLRSDILGANAEAKRFLMDVELALQPPTLGWMGRMESMVCSHTVEVRTVDAILD